MFINEFNITKKMDYKKLDNISPENYAIYLSDKWNEVISDLEKGSKHLIPEQEAKDALEKRLREAHYINVVIQEAAQTDIGNLLFSEKVRSTGSFTHSRIRERDFHPYSDRKLKSLERLSVLSPGDVMIKYFLAKEYLKRRNLSGAENTINDIESAAGGLKAYSLWADYYLIKEDAYNSLLNYLAHFNSSKNKNERTFPDIVMFAEERKYNEYGEEDSNSQSVSFSEQLLQKMHIDPEYILHRGNEVPQYIITGKMIGLSKEFNLEDVTLYYVDRQMKDVIESRQICVYVTGPTKKFTNQDSGLEESGMFAYLRIQDYARVPPDVNHDLIKPLFDKIGHIPTLINYIERASEQTNDFSSIGILLMNALEYSGHHIRDPLIGRRFLQVLERDPSLTLPKKKEGIFKKVARKSKNPVITIKHDISENLNSEYILKINNPEKDIDEEKKRLQKEYIINVFLENITNDLAINPDTNLFDENLMRVPIYIGLLETNNHVAYIQKKMKRRSLEDIEAECNYDLAPLYKELESTIETLAIIHALGTEHIKNNNGEIVAVDNSGNKYTTRLPNFNHVENLLYRAVGKTSEGRLGANSKFMDFLTEYKKLFDDQPLKFFIHGDLYPQNCFEGGVIYDFESAAIGSPTQDLIELLEYKEWPDINKPHFIESYLKKISEFNSDSRIPEIIAKEYEKSKLHNALCQTGTMLRMKDEENAKDFLITSLNLMDDKPKLKDLFVRYLKASRRKFIQDVLR